MLKTGKYEHYTYLSSQALVGPISQKELEYFGVTLLCGHVEWSKASLQQKHLVKTSNTAQQE